MVRAASAIFRDSSNRCDRRFLVSRSEVHRVVWMPLAGGHGRQRSDGLPDGAEVGTVEEAQRRTEGPTHCKHQNPEPLLGDPELSHVVHAEAHEVARILQQPLCMRDERQDGSVNRIGMEVVVDAGAHDDHGATLRVDGVLSELEGDAPDHGLRHAGDRLGPRGRAGQRGVVLALGPRPGQTRPFDAVLCEQQIVHGRDQPAGDSSRGHPAAQHAAGTNMRGALVTRLRSIIEARQEDLNLLVIGRGRIEEREQRVGVAEAQVPAALVGFAPAVTEGTVRDRDRSLRIEEDGLERRIGLAGERGGGRVVREVVSCDELARQVCAFAFLERNEEGRVGVLLHVFEEKRLAARDMEALEDHVSHRHAERAVGPRVDREPFVGEFRGVGVVRRDDHDLRAFVPDLGHEVGVGCARDGHVGAPEHEVPGVEPVAGFGDVGLVAEDLRRRHGKIGVPVVEGQDGAAEQRVEPRPRAVGDRRHRGDDGEARAAIRSVGLDGVDVSRGDESLHLVPTRSHEATLAALRLVAARALGILHDRRPGFYRIRVCVERLAPQLEQDAPDVGIAHARR